MGSDEELRLPLKVTPQQSYYAQRYYLEQHGTPEQVAEFCADGPPPPEKEDGVTGKILYYEAHTPTLDEVGALLEEMAAGGWITDGVRGVLAELPLGLCVAELKARMVEPDVDQRQPSSGSSDPA